MRELISHLPVALPWAALISGTLLMLARLVSKLLSELRGIIHARTFHLLGKAVVEKANWTDAGTVRSVLTLMREIDDNAARQPAVGRAPAVASHPDDELPDTE